MNRALAKYRIGMEKIVGAKVHGIVGLVVRPAKADTDTKNRALAAIAEAAAPLVPGGTEVLAGLELGGVPIATALSLRTGIPLALVR